MKLTCRKFYKKKSKFEFGKDSKKKNEKSTICKQCKSIEDKKSYVKRTAKISAQKKEKRRLFKIEYEELKKTLKCKKCGESKYYLLDFHHIDKHTKKFNIGIMSVKSFNITKIKEEIKKCIPLCSNCHREFHHFERENDISIIEYLKIAP